ncbi:MAG TPA: PQQ-binding-like beta-propeller repeat protein [Pirellulales bacterium]|nr:PQQ-binding-like beta-propeller repeat protein [Pirellulales bacterium]
MKIQWVTPVVAVILVWGTSPLFAQSGSSPLISEIQAQRHGLTRAWFAQVQMDSHRDRIQSLRLHYDLPLSDDDEKGRKAAEEPAAEKLDPSIANLEDHGVLIVQTKQGVVQLLDALTGKSIWTVHVESNKATSIPAISRDLVAVTRGSSLHIYKRDDGSLIWTKRVNRGPGAGTAISGSYVFVATTSGIVNVYDLEEKGQPPWEYHSKGHGFVQPFATPASVSWGTDFGKFFVLDLQKLGPRFPAIETQDEIVAQPAYIAPNFYVGSRDGFLYKIHEKQGTEAWRFSTGEPIEHTPVAVDGFIFLTTLHGGLYCVVGDVNVVGHAFAKARKAAADRGEEVPKTERKWEEGEEVWWTPGIAKVLAVTPTRVYGLDDFGHTRILRRDTGQLIDTMHTQNQSLSLINRATDRIYLGTKSGLIQCLHEPAIEKPLKYMITSPVNGGPSEIEQGEAAEDGEKPGDDGGDQQQTEDLFSGDDDRPEDDDSGEDNLFDDAPSDDEPADEEATDESDDENPF